MSGFLTKSQPMVAGRALGPEADLAWAGTAVGARTESRPPGRLPASAGLGDPWVHASSPTSWPPPGAPDPMEGPQAEQRGRRRRKTGGRVGAPRELCRAGWGTGLFREEASASEALPRKCSGDVAWCLAWFPAALRCNRHSIDCRRHRRPLLGVAGARIALPGLRGPSRGSGSGGVHFLSRTRGAASFRELASPACALVFYGDIRRVFFAGCLLICCVLTEF